MKDIRSVWCALVAFLSFIAPAAAQEGDDGGGELVPKEFWVAPYGLPSPMVSWRNCDP